MKKLVLFFVMIVSFFLLFGQERKADIVVLLDTSGTMLPHYTDINERVLGELCSNFVRIGDTFHLLSFAEKTAAEISQKINQQTDVQKIVSRFSLLYPLGAFSDFLNGLLYSQQYIASLDVYTQKVLVIISDGIFNPSKNSPYFSLSPADADASIKKSIETMISQGVYVYYIKAPFPENIPLKNFAGNLTNSESNLNILSDASADNDLQQNPTDKIDDTAELEAMTEYASSLAEIPSVVTTELETISQDTAEGALTNVLQLPTISCPSDLGNKRYSFTLPLTITNGSKNQIVLQLDKVVVNERNILNSTAFISIEPESSSVMSVPVNIPPSFPSGETLISAQFVFADNVRTNPQTLQWSMILVEGSPFLSKLPASSFRIFIIIAAVLACLVVLFVILWLSKKLSSTKMQKENEQPSAVSHSTTDLLSLTNVNVSTSKLTLPVLATAIAQEPEKKVTVSSPKKAETPPSVVQKNAVSSVYKKADTLSIDASKVSTMKLDVTSRNSSIPVSETQKNSARDLANFKQDNALSLSNTPSIAVSNKLVLPQLPKSSSLSLPSISLKNKTSLPPANSNEKIPLAKEGTVILELYVEGQNRKIGTRNIHALSAGSRKSIGGGLSIFSIFFIKVPSNIAEIRYDGKTCTLALLKPEYFPEAESNLIDDCLNKPITIRSDHGFLTTIKFTEYQSQTEKLNNLLLSVVPEEDKKKYI